MFPTNFQTSHSFAGRSATDHITINACPLISSTATGPQKRLSLLRSRLSPIAKTIPFRDNKRFAFRKLSPKLIPSQDVIVVTFVVRDIFWLPEWWKIPPKMVERQMFRIGTIINGLTVHIKHFPFGVNRVPFNSNNPLDVK